MYIYIIMYNIILCKVFLYNLQYTKICFLIGNLNINVIIFLCFSIINIICKKIFACETKRIPNFADLR